MSTYDEFHGRVPQKDIGKRLREIVKVEKSHLNLLRVMALPPSVHSQNMLRFLH